MLANALKGEVAVQAGGTDYTFVLSWPALKACEKRFAGRFAEEGEVTRFRDVAMHIEEMVGEDVGFIFWAGLQHYHPEMTEEAADLIISQIGPLAMYAVLGESIRLSYDSGKADDAPPRPRKARSAAGT